MPADEEVGYKRPPKRTQFRKGQSGNPRGRPKGTRNLRTDLAEELGKTITITEQGSRRRISKQRALIKSILNKGIANGNMRAAALILNMVAQNEAKQGAQQIPELSAEDRAIVEAYAQQVVGNAKGGSS